MPTLNNSTTLSEPSTSTVSSLTNEESAQTSPPTYTQSLPYHPDGSRSSTTLDPAAVQPPRTRVDLPRTPAAVSAPQEQATQAVPETHKRKRSDGNAIFALTAGNWTTINFNLNLCQHSHLPADAQTAKIRKTNNGGKKKSIVFVGDGSKEQPFTLEE